MRRVGVVVAVALGLGAGPAEAAFPGENGPIVFAGAGVGGNYDVFSMDADGSNLTNLTANTATDYAPVLSGDASKIAFASDRTGLDDIFAMNPDGSVETNLTNTAEVDRNPSFGPDGRIAYSRNVAGIPDIFVMNADGTGQVNLTASPAAESDPAFSSDGSRIAYTRDFDIFVMNADGTGQVNLTVHPDAESSATWSPDGAQIAFHSDRSGGFDIYAMGGDGSGVTQLTSDPGGDFYPAFSPDGSKMLFQTNRDGNDEVYVMNRDGSGQTNLTQAPFAQGLPDWGARPLAPATTAPRAPDPPSTSPPGATGSSPRTTAPGSILGAGLGSSATITHPANAVASLVFPAVPSSAPSPGSAPTPGSATPPSGQGSEPGPPARRPANPAPRSAGTEGPPNPERSRFSTFLIRPDALPLSLEDIGRSLGIAALLVALISFTARIFNATVKANRDELARAFAPLLRALRAISPTRAQLLLGAVATSVIAGAIVHWFLEPGFPGTPGSDAFALGMLLGFGVIIANTVLTWRTYMRRRLPDVPGRWVVFPGQIAVSIVCVTVSRLAHFVPGLIVGMAGDYIPDRRLETHHLGRRAAFTAASVVVISLGAWFASIPVADAAAEPGAGFATLVLDSALAVVAVAGMETLVFTLAPFLFLDGYHLFHWHRLLWLLLWGLGALWVSFVIVNPALSHYEGEAKASVAWLATLLLIQALVALSLWGFFALRRRPPALPAR